MTLTFELDLDRVILHSRAKCLKSEVDHFVQTFFSGPTDTRTQPIALPGPLKWLVINYRKIYLRKSVIRSCKKLSVRATPVELFKARVLARVFLVFESLETTGSEVVLKSK